MKISIAMASYNGEEFISEQLASLAQQILLPFELVVCDDCSKDSTVRLIEAFAETAPFPVRIFRNPETLGYRKNFMKSAELCEGDVIAFCDQDDIWHPAKLSEVAKTFDDAGVYFVYHNADICDRHGVTLGRRLYDDEAETQASRAVALPWHFSLGFTQAFRRELLAYGRYWPMSRDSHRDVVEAHDQWFFFLATIKGQTRYLAKSLASYRQHGSNVSGSKENTIRSRIKVAVERSFNFKPELLLACAGRITVLGAIRRDDPTVPEIVDRQIRLYEVLSRKLELRHAIYKSRSHLRSALALARCVREGVYRRQMDWDFSGKTALKDLLGGVVMKKSY